MTKELSLTEQITKRHNEIVEPMKKDVEEFVKILKEYFISNNMSCLTIKYKVRHARNSIGFFGIPLFGDDIIIKNFFVDEITAAWRNLLLKWYFEKNGYYIFSAVENEVKTQEFSFNHDFSFLHSNEAVTFIANQ